MIVPWNSADLPAVKPQQLIRTFGTHVFLSPSVPCLWLITIFYWSVLACLIHVSVVVIKIYLGQLFPLFLSIFGHHLFLSSGTRDNVVVVLLDRSIFHSIDNKNTLFFKSMRPLSQPNINAGRLTTKMRSLCQIMLNLSRQLRTCIIVVLNQSTSGTISSRRTLPVWPKETEPYCFVLSTCPRFSPTEGQEFLGN